MRDTNELVWVVFACAHDKNVPNNLTAGSFDCENKRLLPMVGINASLSATLKPAVSKIFLPCVFLYASLTLSKVFWNCTAW